MEVSIVFSKASLDDSGEETVTLSLAGNDKIQFISHNKVHLYM